MKYFLFIQSYDDLNGDNNHNICRFLVFNEYDPRLKGLYSSHYYKKCIFQINETQYDFIKNIDNFGFSKITKVDFLIQNKLEEFAI